MLCSLLFLPYFIIFILLDLAPNPPRCSIDMFSAFWAEVMARIVTNSLSPADISTAVKRTLYTLKAWAAAETKAVADERLDDFVIRSLVVGHVGSNNCNYLK